MNSTDLIKPIEFIGPGQCYQCGSHLVVYENELASFLLDKNGMPTRHEIEYCSLIGICPSCKKRYRMNRSGMHYAIGTAKNDVEQDGASTTTDNPFKKE